MPHLYLMDYDIGTYPKSAAKGSYIYSIKRGKSLTELLDKVWNDIPDGWVTGMSIMAHAGEAIVENQTTQRSEISVAGFFLGQLVNGDTVYQFEKLRSLFNAPKSVVCNLLSCSQALDTADIVDEKTGMGYSGKNSQVVKALAISLNQFVRAADKAQVFNPSQSGFDRVWRDVGVDFGAWEGTVYLFSPDGNVKQDK